MVAAPLRCSGSDAGTSVEHFITPGLAATSLAIGGGTAPPTVRPWHLLFGT